LRRGWSIRALVGGISGGEHQHHHGSYQSDDLRKLHGPFLRGQCDSAIAKITNASIFLTWIKRRYFSD